MYLEIALLLSGLFILILGGDFLVRGASSIALGLRISPMVVGLTIVAFGTSTPELLISIKAALSGSPDLTMGNVVGSNICNLALVLGVTALISPIYVASDSVKIDWPVTMASSILLFLIAREGFINIYEGVIFIFLLILYLIFLIVKSRKENQRMEELESLASESLGHKTDFKALSKDIGFMILGCIGLYFGAEWFVGGAKTIALNLGVSERVIGITVLALGTSLPELTTAIIASLKKQTDLALGNLLGSNIFNILSILGITSIITEIQVNDLIVNEDMIWMMGITLLILPFMVTGRHLQRWEGAVLVVIYLYYTINVII